MFKSNTFVLEPTRGFLKWIAQVHVILMLTTLPVLAQEQENTSPIFTFNGFGTVGVVHSSERTADYVLTNFDPNGPGYTHRWTADTDSILGFQVNAQLSTKLSAVLQMTLEQRYDNTYKPAVEWANLKYQITPDLSVRVGRIVLPSLAFADTRNIGYTFPWVRLPTELYYQTSITKNDGIDFDYRIAWDDYVNNVRFFYGGIRTPYPGGGDAYVRNLLGLEDVLETGALTVRLYISKAKIRTTQLNAFMDGYRALGPAGEAVADKYDIENTQNHIVGFGAAYDPGRWFLRGEFAQLEAADLAGHRQAWYISSGVRRHKFTPYFTFSKVKMLSPSSTEGIDVTTLPPVAAATGAFLNAALNNILQNLPTQRAISVGVRWDWARNTDLKIQYDHIKRQNGSAGTFANIQPDFNKDKPVHLFSVIADFVF